MASRCLQDAFKMQSFFHSFFDIVFYRFLSQLGSNLAPTWPQLGPQIHPKTHPRPILERKSEKNPTKMGPKLITFNQHEPKDPQSRPRTASCTSFSSIFDRFLMPKIIPKSSENCSESVVKQKSAIPWFCSPFHHFLMIFHAQGDQKPMKNRWKILLKTSLKINIIFYRFVVDFASQNRSKNQ